MHLAMYLNDIMGFFKNVLILGGMSILVAIALYATLLLFLPKRFPGIKVSQFLLLFYFSAFVIWSFLPAGFGRENNFIPFQSIYSSLCSSSEVPKYILFFNILSFVPMGILLPWIFPELKKWHKVAGASLCVCLTRELMQLVLWYRVFDIDSLLFAALGSLAGYGVFLLISRAINKNGKGVNPMKKV